MRSTGAGPTRLPAIGLLVAALALAPGCGGSDDPAENGGAGGAEGAFPAPPKVRHATVWALGDAITSDPGRQVARLVGGADRVIYLGDVYEHGTAEEFRANFDPLYGRIRNRVLPTPGNHEWANHEEGYDPYWARVTGGTPPLRYGVRIAGWTLLSVNSEGDLDPGSDQIRWLEAAVRAPGNCRIAFWHRPRYSAGAYPREPRVDAAWDTVAGKAALVLNGHDHNLQELKPREGTTQLISGAGGRDLYEVNENDPLLAWGEDESFGALRLRLAPGRASWRFVSADGTTLRRGRTRCSG